METLALIEKMSDCLLSKDALNYSENDPKELFDIYDSIETSLFFGEKYPEHMNNLKSSLGNVCAQINVGSKRAEFSLVLPYLTSLQHAIERDTIGPDGWPLRK